MVKDMSDKRLQILVSAVNKDAQKLPEAMNIESDAVIVNQLIGQDENSCAEESE